MKLLLALALLSGGCAHWFDCKFGGTDMELPCYCADNTPYHGVCPVKADCSCIPNNPVCVPPPGSCPVATSSGPNPADYPPLTDDSPINLTGMGRKADGGAR